MLSHSVPPHSHINTACISRRVCTHANMAETRLLPIFVADSPLNLSLLEQKITQLCRLAKTKLNNTSYAGWGRRDVDWNLGFVSSAFRSYHNIHIPWWDPTRDNASVNSSCAHPPPPPRANSRALALFLFWVANSRGWGWKKRANAPPPGYRRIRFEREIHNHNDLSRSRFSVVAEKMTEIEETYL